MGSGPFKNAEEGVGSKNYQCQFHFFDPSKNTHTNNFGGIKSF